MKVILGQAGIGLVLVAVVAMFWSMHDMSGMSAPALPRALVAGGTVFGWIGMTFLFARRDARADVSVHDANGILVVHASQTGFATELAGRTVATLRAGGRAVDARSMDEVTPALLANAKLALFVVSTTGEGDAPDMATGFRRGVMASPLPLHRLSYGVLALGDRDYGDFCAFGRDVDRWLRASGASPSFDLVEVDNGDEGALRHWQHHVGQLAGTHDLPDWTRPAYRPWRLVQRTLLNPGSVGGACFHVALVPDDASLLAWDAGDIAEIGPRLARHDATVLPHREYSIASIPADGAMHLVVRQQRDQDGVLGAGSGWLTAHAEIGDVIDVRVRRNAGFHAPADDRPLLLIGNGTGIAGLRALIKERIARGHPRNWLVYGERNASADRLHVDELERWRDEGRLERLDLVWSRDDDGAPSAMPDPTRTYVQGTQGRRDARGTQAAPTVRLHHVQDSPRYVQDRLRVAAADVRRFVDQGASIYVCGSLAGMAPGVDAALRGILGDAAVDTLVTTGRYRRDVY